MVIVEDHHQIPSAARVAKTLQKRRRLAGCQRVGFGFPRRPKSQVISTEIKGAILEASAAVVAIITYAGGELMTTGSGTIIGCEDVNGTYISTILTSATLLRSSWESNAIEDDIKVKVYLGDDKFFEGYVSSHDFHFNIATINVTSDVALPTANLGPLDDNISMFPSETTSLQSQRHLDSFKIRPGDVVVALGRFNGAPRLWYARGEFSTDSCRFDCRELFRASCIILQTGIGGPLINRHGEVIGVNFYGDNYTPFLPINIVSKCLEQFKKNRQSRRPWIGMALSNLYAAPLGKLEKVISKFSISEGVLVDEVIKGSPAEQAGIRRGDVIVQCGKKFVHGFLEFYDVMWKKVGKSMEVVVMRESSAAHLNLKVFVDQTSPDELNSFWSIPTSKNG
ncbi:putative protease Do-like 14 isoform X2 [Rhododendron vialii]|uniref:putative protease Do-like 14 isoform X2 n=1 Tax=Rhododendron vialii TaxID=182163 RepID=UPI00265E3C64|nr:putative protease Do-like 14 isoform X2 [Rhododendron vialii]